MGVVGIYIYIYGRIGNTSVREEISRVKERESRRKCASLGHFLSFFHDTNISRNNNNIYIYVRTMIVCIIIYYIK